MLCELAWIFEYSYVIWLIWKLHIHERSWETWNVCNRCWLISFVDPLYKLCLIGHTFPIGFHFSLNFEANVSLITVVIYRIGESKISIILDSQRVHVLFLWYLVLSKSCHQSYINPVQCWVICCNLSVCWSTPNHVVQGSNPDHRRNFWVGFDPDIQVYTVWYMNICSSDWLKESLLVKLCS